MLGQYTKEEFWKLYEKLSQELKDAIFAGETADYIGSICERHNIKEGAVSEVAKQVRNVLLGLLPSEDFQKTLEELGIEKEVAEKMAREISRFIFYPVKPALEQLYGTKEIGGEVASGEEIEHEQKKTAGEDRYREIIE